MRTHKLVLQGILYSSETNRTVPQGPALYAQVTLDTYLWLIAAITLFLLSFSLPSEARARGLLAAGLSGWAFLQPEFWWVGLLGVLQLLPLLFIVARMRYAHPHLTRWIDLFAWSPDFRNQLKLHWLERYLINNRKAPPVSVSSLQPLVVSALLEPQNPTPSGNGEKGVLAEGYTAWKLLEAARRENSALESLPDTLRGYTHISSQWFDLLGTEPAKAQLAARALKLQDGFWTGRAWFLEGTRKQDPIAMQQGANLMLSGLRNTLEFYAFKRQEADRLLRPFGVNFEAQAERTGPPWVTLGLLALCLGMFFWESQAGGIEDGKAFFFLGANLPELTLSSEPWRLLTSSFLHAGFLHIGLNGFYLWSFGSALERRIGSPLLLFLYVLTAVVGSYFSAAFGSGNLSVGASGAIFGIVAALGVVGDGNTAQRLRRLVTAVPNLAIMLAIGFLIPNVDIWAHLGGLLAGLVLGLVYTRPRPLESGVLGVLALGAIGWAFWSLLEWQKNVAPGLNLGF